MMWSRTGSTFWLQLVIDTVLLVANDDIVTLNSPHTSRRGRGSGETAGDTVGSQGVGEGGGGGGGGRGSLTWSASPDSSYS